MNLGFGGTETEDVAVVGWVALQDASGTWATEEAANGTWVAERAADGTWVKQTDS